MIEHVRSHRNVTPGDAPERPTRRPLLGALFLAGTLLLAACGGGGGGDVDEEPVDDFAVNVVEELVSVAPGGTATVDVELTRDELFEDDVTLTFESLPAGVTVEETDRVLEDGVDAATFTLRAAADAALVEADEVTVTATAGEDSDFDTFDVSVEEAAPVADAGDPDPAFGTEGEASYVFGGTAAAVHAIEVQDDGSMIVAASKETGTGTELVLARVDAAGELDVDFGEGVDAEDGFTTTPLFGTVDALAMDVGADVITVAVVTEESDGTHSFELFEYDATGISAGAGVTTDFAGVDFETTDLEFLADGDVIAAGYGNGNPPDADDTTVDDTDTDLAVTRFDADGSFDETFAGTVSDVLYIDQGGEDLAHGVEVLADGDFLLFGQAGTGAGADFTAVRVTPGGALDTDTFGSGDRLDVDFAGGFDAAYAAEVDADGDIVMAGAASELGADTDFALVRFDPAGVLDETGFGAAGTTTTDLGGDDEIDELALHEGAILAAGTTTSAEGVTSMALARYDADGTLDTGFGDGGFVVIDFGDATTADANALAADEERIVVGGEAGDEAALAAFLH